MPSSPSRNVPAAARAALEDASSPDALIAFLTITHPGLTDPIRLVGDTLDYQMGGNDYTGVVFSWAVLDDGDGSAQAELTLPDSDPRVGQALRQATGEARVSVRIMTSADFDLTKVPRLPVGTPQPIYSFTNLVLLSASADGQQISCQIGLRDYSQEPWPCLYATETRLPGLFR